MPYRTAAAPPRSRDPLEASLVADAAKRSRRAARLGVALLLSVIAGPFAAAGAYQWAQASIPRCMCGYPTWLEHPSFGGARTVRYGEVSADSATEQAEPRWLEAHPPPRSPWEPAAIRSVRSAARATVLGRSTGSGSVPHCAVENVPP